MDAQLTAVMNAQLNSKYLSFIRDGVIQPPRPFARSDIQKLDKLDLLVDEIAFTVSRGSSHLIQFSEMRNSARGLTWLVLRGLLIGQKAVHASEVQTLFGYGPKPGNAIRQCCCALRKFLAPTGKRGITCSVNRWLLLDSDLNFGWITPTANVVDSKLIQGLPGEALIKSRNS